MFFRCMESLVRLSSIVLHTPESKCSRMWQDTAFSYNVGCGTGKSSRARECLVGHLMYMSSYPR